MIVNVCLEICLYSVHLIFIVFKTSKNIYYERCVANVLYFNISHHFKLTIN